MKLSICALPFFSLANSRSTLSVGKTTPVCDVTQTFALFNKRVFHQSWLETGNYLLNIILVTLHSLKSCFLVVGNSVGSSLPHIHLTAEVIAALSWQVGNHLWSASPFKLIPTKPPLHFESKLIDCSSAMSVHTLEKGWLKRLMKWSPSMNLWYTVGCFCCNCSMSAKYTGSQRE